MKIDLKKETDIYLKDLETGLDKAIKILEMQGQELMKWQAQNQALFPIRVNVQKVRKDLIEINRLRSCFTHFLKENRKN